MRLRDTPADDELRASVAELILTEMEGRAFLEAGGFEHWAKTHKPIMRDLFGGQGLQNLVMVVAWWRREELGRHEGKPPPMSHVARAIEAGELEKALASSFLKTGITNKTSLIRAALLNPGLARALIRGQSTADGGISAAVRAEILRELGAGGAVQPHDSGGDKARPR